MFACVSICACLTHCVTVYQHVHAHHSVRHTHYMTWRDGWQHMHSCDIFYDFRLRLMHTNCEVQKPQVHSSMVIVSMATVQMDWVEQVVVQSH